MNHMRLAADNQKVTINSWYINITGILLDLRECKKKKIHIDSFTLQPNCSSRLFYNLLLSVSVSASWGKVSPVDQIHSLPKKTQKKKMCTNKQRSDVPFPLPFLPVSAACRVGVENEWKWRSGVDKIRGERQEGCGHGRRGREHAEVPLRRVFRTPAEDRNWQTECATSWWQPSFQPYFTQVCMKSCQIVFTTVSCRTPKR